jgi:N6-L-threonylcarbamoyladenine synthase
VVKVLGVETSCDETAAAVVEDGRRLLSNVVASSLDLHIPFGGVVPEIAARSHIESILPVIDKALEDALVTSHQSSVNSKRQMEDWRLATRDKRLFDPWDQIDAIAVTQGPGLLGSLLIGVLTARTLAIAKNKPLYGVNHVEAHVYAAFLMDKQPHFPLLALIVSGGHTQLVLFKNHFDYKVLGRTADDAVGEAFDKVAKILGLPYPGGPSIAKAAKKGNPDAVSLPAAKMERKYDFSFSGLKTAVLRAAQTQTGHAYDFPSAKLPEALKGAQKANIAASFQKTAVETLVKQLKNAEEEFRPKSIVIAGGVAANEVLRKAASKQLSTPVIYPSIELCTDNAAMIAALGYHLASNKRPEANPYSLEPDPGLKM